MCLEYRVTHLLHNVSIHIQFGFHPIKTFIMFKEFFKEKIKPSSHFPPKGI